MTGRLRTGWATKLLSLLLLALPAVVQAQFTFTTNNGTITITGYTCPGSVMAVIPSTINCYRVTSIADNAFQSCQTLTTSVTIPDSVTSIGQYAFDGSGSYSPPLTNVSLGNGITSIGNFAFEFCKHLPSVTIPNSVVSLGEYAFGSCTSLTNVIFGKNVTSLGPWVFRGITGLMGVYFRGDAPYNSGVFVAIITDPPHRTALPT